MPRRTIESESSYRQEEEEVSQPLRRQPSRRARREGGSSQPSRRPGKEIAQSSRREPSPPPSPSPPRPSRSVYPTDVEVLIPVFKDISTSDFQTPATMRREYFNNLAAQKRFLKFYPDKFFHPGTSLDLSCINDWNIRPFFERQGWLHYLGMSEPSYVIIMKLFYANFRMTSQAPDSVSYFRGRDFLISAEFLAQILNVPNDGYDIFDFDLNTFQYPQGHSKDTANIFLHKEPSARTLIDPASSDMFDVCRLMGNILNFSVLSKSRRGECFGCHKLLIYLVMNDLPVNLPKLILNQMYQFLQYHSGFGYGMVITRIFRALRFDLSDLESIKAPIFGKDRVRRMGISLQNPRPIGLIGGSPPHSPIHVPPYQAPHDPQPHQPQPEPPHHGEPFHYSQHAMYEHIREIRQELTVAREERKTIMRYLRRIMSCVGAASSSAQSPRRRGRRSQSGSSRHSAR